MAGWLEHFINYGHSVLKKQPAACSVSRIVPQYLPPQKRDGDSGVVGSIPIYLLPFLNGYHSKVSKAFKQKERLQKKKSHHNYPGTCYSSALHHAVMLIRFYVGCRAKPMFGWLAPPRGRGEKIAMMNYQFLELELLLVFYPMAGCGRSTECIFVLPRK
jgi:hypothetical protein